MKAKIERAIFDGEVVYQVVEVVDDVETGIVYTSGSVECAEKYCENNYGGDWSKYRRAYKQYKDDREGGTELSMVLNHKIWERYEKDEKIARVYDKLWEKF